MKLFTAICALAMGTLLITGCKKEEVPVDETPVACIEANDSYAFGETVSFPDCSKNGKDYLWEFGVGPTSTERAPTYQFSQTISYEVKLTVTNYKGAQDIATKTITIRDATPQQIEGNYNVQSYCSPSGDFDYTMSITPTGANTVSISNFGGLVTVNATLQDFFVVIPQQVVNGITVSGNGTIDVNLEDITFTYSINDDNFSDSCSDYARKQQ